MDETLKKIEEVFRRSSSPDELFDSFRIAIELPVTDMDVYKVLLGNPVLSTDELKMFSEKLVKAFPNDSFNMLMWTAKILGSYKDDISCLEDSVHYYQRAYSVNPLSETTLVNLLGLYNYELNLSENNTIINFVESSVVSINKKSLVYYSLSDHYKRLGDITIAAKYFALAEKSQEREKD